jgi:hypothetical protein
MVQVTGAPPGGSGNTPPVTPPQGNDGGPAGSNFPSGSVLILEAVVVVEQVRQVQFSWWPWWKWWSRSNIFN